MSAPLSLLERKSTFWSVAILITVLFCGTNLPWTLDDYDQAKQAFTSFEMVQDGHWFYQHTPKEKIATKPPLVGWISAAIYGVTRSWEVAWRLPSIAAAVVLLLVLTQAAREVYGTAAGLLAMSAFGLNLLSPRLATLVRTDMVLALVIFLLGLQIWKKVRAGEGWSSRDQWISFALLTAAMLVKGPIVYAFLLPGIVAFQWWTRRTRGPGSAWCGWWPWIASLLIFLAWAAAGIAWQPGFYEQVVLKEFAGRFGETAHRPQPFYFYLPHLLHKFAPWSVLLIAFGVVMWRREQAALGARWRSLFPAVAWLVFWSLGGLVVMSLIPSKRVDRIFPIVPPLCLLIAAGIGHFRREGMLLAGKMVQWGAAALFLACLYTTGYAAQKIVLSYRAGDAALVEFGAAVRREAAAQGWRYEVIGGKEEGLLLYLRRTHFLRMDEAVQRWKAGSLDALVVPAEDLPQLLPALRGAVPTEVEGAITVNDHPRRYLLLKRS